MFKPDAEKTKQKPMFDEPMVRDGVITITGEIRKVIYRNDCNAFTIMALDTVNGEVIAVGEMPEIYESDTVDLTGSWKTSKKYGKQFAVTSVTVKDLNEKGIRKFLAASIKGVGKVFAAKIVDTFGLQTLDVISNYPEKLYEIKGVGKKRVDALVESWQAIGKKNEIICFLQNHGLGIGRAEAVYHLYGNDTINIVKENPYKITEVKGIGFKVADAVALSLGEPADSVNRCRAALRYSISKMASEGHCFAYKDELIKKAASLLDFHEELEEPSQDEIDESIDNAILRDEDGVPYDFGSPEEPEKKPLDPYQLVAGALSIELKYGQQGTEMGFVRGDLVADEDESGKQIVYARAVLNQEKKTAFHIARILKGSTPWRHIDFEKSITSSEKKLSIQLSAHQKKAIVNSLCSNMSVITGGPGVGKTTVLNVLIDVAIGAGCKVRMAAPTGKAAKRMSEATGACYNSKFEESVTIHRLLEYNGKTHKFMRNEANPIECDLLVIDEFSMSDLKLAYSLFSAVGNNTAVILVGDIDQLASVGAGYVLHDVIDSKKVAVSRLTEIFRQAAASKIIINAHRINSGHKPETNNHPDDDFFFIHADTLGAIEREIVSLVTQRLPNRYGFDAKKDIQVLSPMYKNEAGVNSINSKIQASLNPPSADKAEVKRFDVIFREGDKIIYTTNNYDMGVVNGDCGFISSINKEDEVITVRFDGKNELSVLGFNDLDSMQLAYAMTIHKSQGSEYPCVIMPVTTSHYIMLDRNLYYTGITRGKQIVVMVGQDRALGVAAKTVRSKKRNTMLKSRIIKACNFS